MLCHYVQQFHKRANNKKAKHCFRRGKINFSVRLKILIYLYGLFKIIFTMLHKSIDL